MATLGSGPVGGVIGGAIGLGIGIYAGHQIWDHLIASKGIDENTDLTAPSTWPKPPVEGECKEGEPSKKKPRDRGEKSLWDPKGGEWRPHKPDKYHPEGHWDHKPPGPNTPWIDVPIK